MKIPEDLTKLDVFVAHEQPEECSKCGSRTTFEEIKNGTLQTGILQFHRCLNPDCKFEFLLEEGDFYHQVKTTFEVSGPWEHFHDIPYEEFLKGMIYEALHLMDDDEKRDRFIEVLFDE